MGLIYKLTFSNSKIYIGQTSVSFQKRLAKHRSLSRKSNPEFRVHKAWKKYGEPCAEILAYVEDCELTATEQRAIGVFNSFGRFGYNMTPGGETSAMKGKRHSNATKARISVASKNCSDAVKMGRSERLKKAWDDGAYRSRMETMAKQLWCDPEYQTKISLALKGKTPMLGKRHSLETKEQMSANRKGKPWSEARRAAEDAKKKIK